MQEIKITRKFVYNGIDLPDPGLSMSATAVRDFYTSQYPELGVSVVEGPTTKGSVSTYTFARAAGVKGKGDVDKFDMRACVKQIAAGGQIGNMNGVLPKDLGGPAIQKMTSAMQELPLVGTGIQMHMPSEAFGIWG